MARSRLQMARPEVPDGRVLLIAPPAMVDLDPFEGAAVTAIQPLQPDHDQLATRQIEMAATPEGEFATIVITWPRSRDLGRAYLYLAAQHLSEGGGIWVDGQKTDGIDAALKELRQFGDVSPPISAAHGKIARFSPRNLPAEWGQTARIPAPGFTTEVGMFSAGAVDPGSALLASHLPDKLPSRIADLGAGWGWLAAQALARKGVQSVHLVEADARALECARANVADPRAQFHWADATTWSLREPVNGVIMNPPFHQGRRADPGLGRAFIRTAAGILTAAGRLWMVANRHLPYEAALSEHFSSVEEIGSDPRFKILTATGAGRVGRPK